MASDRNRIESFQSLSERQTLSAFGLEAGQSLAERSEYALALYVEADVTQKPLSSRL